MTSPYVTFASPHPPAPRSAWPVVRAVLAVLALVGCVPLALLAAFVSAVTWSGCFISCSGTNHPAGAALALLAAALLATGPLLTAALYRSRAWLWVAGYTALGGVLLMALALAAG
jgi:hypothetical protein